MPRGDKNLAAAAFVAWPVATTAPLSPFVLVSFSCPPPPPLLLTPLPTATPIPPPGCLLRRRLAFNFKRLLFLLFKPDPPPLFIKYFFALVVIRSPAATPLRCCCRLDMSVKADVSAAEDEVADDEDNDDNDPDAYEWPFGFLPKTRRIYICWAIEFLNGDKGRLTLARPVMKSCSLSLFRKIERERERRESYRSAWRKSPSSSQHHIIKLNWTQRTIPSSCTDHFF